MERTKEQSDAIALMCLQNIASEADARRLQLELMSMPGLEPTHLYGVAKASAEEASHSLFYEEMYHFYSGVNLDPDMAKSALSALTKELDSEK